MTCLRKRKKLDLVFVLTASDSVYPQELQFQLNFTKEIVRKLDIGSNDSLVALFTYNKFFKEHFDFKSFSDKTQLLQEINKTAPPVFDGNRIGRILRYVKRRMFASYREHKSGRRSDADFMLILITNGRSQDAVNEPARVLQSTYNGIITAIGIGPNVDQHQMQEKIANTPSRYIGLNTFFELKDSVAKVLRDIRCQGNILRLCYNAKIPLKNMNIIFKG
ncbi:matrilin-1-like [Ciona intestinalis]